MIRRYRICISIDIGKNYIGGTDDSLNLIAFLEDQHKEEIPLS